MKQYGKKVWMIPDGYISGKSGSQTSHDAICVLNSGDTDAEITLTLLFEDRQPICNIKATCGAMRTHHIRMDKLNNGQELTVPRDTPYAAILESNVPVVVQYSRLDTTASDTALMTTIAYPVD